MRIGQYTVPLLLAVAIGCPALLAQDEDTYQYEPHDLEHTYLNSPYQGWRSSTLDVDPSLLGQEAEPGSGKVPDGLAPVVSITTLSAPKKAVKAFNKARRLLLKGHLQDARKQLEEAIKIYPDFAAAWCGIAVIELHEQQYDAARNSLETAARLEPGWWQPYYFLAEVEIKQSRWQRAAEVSQRGIEASSIPAPFLHADFAVASFHLERLDEAEDSARYCLELSSESCPAKARHVLGLALYHKGDIKEAAEQLRSYLRDAPNANDRELARQQLEVVERAQVVVSR